ncbi:tectonic-1 isoform X2 [Petaurus breviceps papuanus]|uniref:tectonic-1 isoform X2 n=1 Tax=Petaurus breviceps papuanus TaxID=3040969 RepID=UPI0036D842CE
MAAYLWTEMGEWYLLLLLLVFLGPGAAQGPDPGPQPRAHTESPQDPDAGPTPGSRDKWPESEVLKAAQTASPQLPLIPFPEEEARRALRPSPVTDVSTLCVCDLLAEECDINCCCDPDCTSTDISLFSTCSVRIVSGDSHFCFQKIASYEMNFTAHPPERLFQLMEQTNPSVLCLYTLNYKIALSFITPEFPNENNFDSFLKKSGNFANTKESDISHPTILNAPTATKYKYRDPVQTSDSFLKLPCPLVGPRCSDNNPVGFLMNEIFRCDRKIILEQCGEDRALDMSQYIQPKILAVPNSGKEIPITVQTLLQKSLNGTVTSRVPSDAVLRPTFRIINGLKTCTNVVVLQNTRPFPLSGNPGYFPGLPLIAGYVIKSSRVVRSTNRYGQFTIFHSPAEQNCLLAEGLRKPVVFGYDMITGCQIRLNETTNCKLVQRRLKKLLRGETVPDSVASFGDSSPANFQDWVPVHFSTLVVKRKVNIIPNSWRAVLIFFLH